MNISKLLLASFCLVTISLNAQYLQEYSKIWYFGENAGLSFNYSPPAALTDGALNNIEGCSCVGNQTRLFFYTNGINIWNRNHQIMPNGSGLLGHTSSSQCGLSVPVPSNFLQFYVFTTDANENNLNNGLRYSIVDMQLDNGYGDVTSVKNKLLAPLVTEKITVVPHANETDYWIIAHEWNSNRFLVYRLTSAGLDTVPVISSIGFTYLPTAPSSTGCVCGNAVGFIKASPNGNKIATVVHNSNTIEMYDFDRSTGTLSNLVSSSGIFNFPYGLEFSPNSRYLYMSTIYTYPSSKIYQFDLTQSDFFNHGTLLVNSSPKEFCALVLAPDKKIYIAEYSSQGEGYLSTIEDPDSLGINCNFTESTFFLGGKKSKRGLPNMFYYNPYQSSVSNINIESNIKVFPNPAEAGKTIFLSGIEQRNAIIEIIDDAGRIVHSENISNQRIEMEFILPNVNKGIYIIHVKQGKFEKSTELYIK
ncbi:MAG: hypothetical protein CVU05_04330 [Bacteroidetes bacterium HGW-Bacteroidetes-21]|jgi:hypothetical protein|nr:MAG: hypothetical protein CVU05_04330 [Bacteroidetes bacterium HGW-Bacteroidetes-21]